MTSHPVTRVYRDGGYGWVVVMAAFFTGFITDGLTFSFGILLVDMVEIYQTKRGPAAIAGAIVTGTMDIIALLLAIQIDRILMLLLHMRTNWRPYWVPSWHILNDLAYLRPIAATLSDTYGYRAVVVTGGILSSAGMLASVFVPSLTLLYLTYGILCGVGFGFMYLPACVCVIHNFEKKRTLANGISVCGSGMGMFVFNVLTRFLLDTYSLKGTFLILSGLCLNGVVLGLLLNDPPQGNRRTQEAVQMKCLKVNNLTIEAFTESECEKICVTTNEDDFIQEAHSKCDLRQQCDSCERESTLKTGDAHDPETPMIEQTNHIDQHGTEEADVHKTDFNGGFRNACVAMCDLSLLRYAPFLAFMVSCFCVNFAYIIPIHLLPDQAEQLGIQKQQAAWLVSALGITNTIGRILVGLIGDWKRVNRFAMFVGLVIASGVCTGFSTLLVTFEGKMVYACILGLLLGGFITLTMVVLADTVGLDNLSKAFGLVMCVVGISGALGTPVGGWLFDVAGTYDFTFIISGIVFVVSGVIVSLPKINAWCFQNRE